MCQTPAAGFERIIRKTIGAMGIWEVGTYLLRWFSPT